MHTLKAVSVKFAYYALGIFPVLFLILGKNNVFYAFAAAIYALIANHFLRNELKKRFPIQERNLSTFLALILFVISVVLLIIFRFGATWLHF